MSSLINPNTDCLSDDASYEPHTRTYLRLGALPSGYITAHQLRVACRINGTQAHERIQDSLDALEERGWLSYSCHRQKGNNRMYYYISLEPLPSILPNLPDAPKSFKDKDTTDSRQFLRYFSKLQVEKTNVPSKHEAKSYVLAAKILERTDLRTAKKAAREYWNLRADFRKSHDIGEFSYRLDEMLGRIQEEREELNRADRADRKKKKLTDRTYEQYLEDEIKYWGDNENMVAPLRDELKAIRNGQA